MRGQSLCRSSVSSSAVRQFVVRRSVGRAVIACASCSFLVGEKDSAYPARRARGAGGRRATRSRPMPLSVQAGLVQSLSAFESGVVLPLRPRCASGTPSSSSRACHRARRGRLDAQAVQQASWLLAWSCQREILAIEGDQHDGDNGERA